MKIPTKEIYSKTKEIIKKSIRKEMMENDKIVESISLASFYISNYRFSIKQVSSIIDMGIKEITRTAMKKAGFDYKENPPEVLDTDTLTSVWIQKCTLSACIARTAISKYIIRDNEWEDVMKFKCLDEDQLIRWLIHNQDVPFHIIQKYGGLISYEEIIQNKEFSKESDAVVFNDILQLYGYEKCSRFVNEDEFNKKFKEAHDAFMKNFISMPYNE